MNEPTNTRQTSRREVTVEWLRQYLAPPDRWHCYVSVWEREDRELQRRLLALAQNRLAEHLDAERRRRVFGHGILGRTVRHVDDALTPYVFLPYVMADDVRHLFDAKGQVTMGQMMKYAQKLLTPR